LYKGKDWHFTADFMTLKEDLSQATMKLNQNFAKQELATEAKHGI
jgi:hypothetical protein